VGGKQIKSSLKAKSASGGGWQMVLHSIRNG